MTKVSIVIPIYNGEAHLDDCIQSACNQTLSEIEIILINDGSTDASGHICDDAALHDNRITVVHQQNKGLSESRNVGLNLAKGEFIMFLDCDDWIDLTACETLYNAAIKHNVKVVTCSYVKEFGTYSTTVRVYPFGTRVMATDGVLRRLVGPINSELLRPQDIDLPVSACMQIIDRKVATQSTFVDTKTIGSAEDLLYQLSVYQNCKEIMYLDKPFYHYRRSSMGTLTTRYMPDKHLKWLELFRLIKNTTPRCLMKQKCFKIALNNRVALSMIGLGLNEIYSDSSAKTISANLSKILESQVYATAISTLKLGNMAFHWKVFFVLCKWKLTYALAWMLKFIEFCRKHSPNLK